MARKVLEIVGNSNITITLPATVPPGYSIMINNKSEYEIKVEP